MNMTNTYERREAILLWLGLDDSYCRRRLLDELDRYGAAELADRCADDYDERHERNANWPELSAADFLDVLKPIATFRPRYLFVTTQLCEVCHRKAHIHLFRRHDGTRCAACLRCSGPDWIVEWASTHHIDATIDGAPISVDVELSNSGEAYTIEEWMSETEESFTVDSHGRWLFHGQPFNGIINSI